MGGQAFMLPEGTAAEGSGFQQAMQRVRLGRLGEAEQLCRQAVLSAPHSPPIHNLLGVVLCLLGRLVEGDECLREAVAGDPGSIEYRLNRVLALRGRGVLTEAEALCREAAALAPSSAVAASLHGAVLVDLNRPGEAVEALDRAVALAPGDAGMVCALAECLVAAGSGDAAVAACRRWIELEPGAAEAHHQMSLALWEQGRLGESWASGSKALQLDPNHAAAILQQAVGLFAAGEAALALDGFRRVVALAPEWREAQVHAASALNYVESASPTSILQEYRRCTAGFATALQRPKFPPPAPADHERRPLRVAFLSPDFRRHSVAYFVEPVLAGLDRRLFEVIGFYNPIGTTGDDDVTRHLRALCDAWVDTGTLSDEQVVQRIAAENIDITVDLAGHTQGNRLAALAMKPARMQMNWLGSPVTTGMASIDYRITDALVDPPGYERYQAETPLRLPGCYVCYRPPGNAPPVSEPPASSAGHITFGSFNNLAKISAATASLWAAVLQAVPASRLLLKSRMLADPGVAAHTAYRLAQFGIDPERLELLGWQAGGDDHLALYRRIDIALDTFPYNGVTTTCEAVWMGVPVVSRLGATHVARQGLTLLTALGLADLAVPDDAAYVARCAALAADLPGLAALRRQLRPRLAASALTDAQRFARNFGEALLQTWHRRTDARAEAKMQA